MPLFDFFKKPGKKESPKSTPAGSLAGQKKQPNIARQPATDNPFSSPEQNKKRYEAAMDFLQFFQEKTPLLNGRPHAGTVLSVAARLGGTSLFRSINKKDFEPGVVVLSEEVNLAYPQLLNLFAFYCKQNGIDVMAKPLVQNISDQDKPLMELAQVQARHFFVPPKSRAAMRPVFSLDSRISRPSARIREPGLTRLQGTPQ